MDELMNDEEAQKAAGNYAKFTKAIKGLAHNMNGHGLARVLVAFAEFPYNKSLPNFRKPSEQELFTLLLATAEVKSILAKKFEGYKPEIEDKVVDSVINNIKRNEEKNEEKQ